MIPRNVQEWINELPAREGWGGWQTAGGSVYEGVQNWSAKGDPSTAIGVWGNVIEDADGEERVNWCVYEGDCVDPVKSGLESAEDAMGRAESLYPEMF